MIDWNLKSLVSWCDQGVTRSNSISEVMLHRPNDFSRDQPRFVELRRRHACHVGTIDQRGGGGGLDKPRRLGSRLTEAFQEGPLDPDRFARIAMTLAPVRCCSAGGVDPQRTHFAVAHVGANPLVIGDDLQLLGGNHEARNLFRMLREQATLALNGCDT